MKKKKAHVSDRFRELRYWTTSTSVFNKKLVQCAKYSLTAWESRYKSLLWQGGVTSWARATLSKFPIYRCHLLARSHGDTTWTSLMIGSIPNHLSTLLCNVIKICSIVDGGVDSAGVVHYSYLAIVGCICWTWHDIQDVGTGPCILGWSLACLFHNCSDDVLTLLQSGHLSPVKMVSLATSGYGPPTQGSGYWLGIFNTSAT